MSELDDIRKRTEGHTPGPWSIEGHGMADALYSGRDSDHHGLNLCTLSNWDRNGVANSRLIAAAPDLLRIATEQEAELAQLRTEREDLRTGNENWQRAWQRVTAERDEYKRRAEAACELAEEGESELRRENARLRKALANIRYTAIHNTQDGDVVHDFVDAALQPTEEAEDGTE
jgi:hypothetical protein